MVAAEEVNDGVKTLAVNVYKYLLEYVKTASSPECSDTRLADMYNRNRHSYESTYRMLSYRWNELQTYNSFLVRCIMVTSIGMIIIVLANMAFISTSVMNLLVVILVVLILFMAIVEYSMLKLRVRKDFQKIRF